MRPRHHHVDVVLPDRLFQVAQDEVERRSLPVAELVSQVLELALLAMRPDGGCRHELPRLLEPQAARPGALEARRASAR